MKQWRSWRNLSLITTGITIAVISLQSSGVLQLLEWTLLNQWFRLRPPESRSIPIALVTISEADIRWAKRWPLSDAQLATLLQRLKRDRPVAVGLDLYRDLPVEPGHTTLLEVFQTMPNLIGIRKAIGTANGPAVSSPPVLCDRDQVAINDLLLDADGVVRRNLLSVNSEGRDIPSLGTKLGLMYLQKVGITPRISPDSTQVDLGQARFHRLASNTGGYVSADTGGFQTLANFLQAPGGLPSVSLQAVMTNQVPAHFFQDKLVFVGAKAESVWGDRFYTPYTTDIKTTWAGVEIHANVAAQIISSAVEGRPLLQGVPESLGWLWLLAWATVGTGLGWSFRSLRWAIVLLPLYVGAIFAIAYSAFLLGWWVVVVAPALAFITAALATRGYWAWEALKQANYFLEQKVQERTQELIAKNAALEQAHLVAEAANRALERLAHTDELTQVANRRFFNEYLQQEWLRMMHAHLPLSLILIDVDFFKLYNDTYGHVVGDDCLVQIAAIVQSVVKRSGNLVARYGGEEFAVVLPNTPMTETLQIANDIRFSVQQAAIPHCKSQVSQSITLSMGAICLVPTPTSDNAISHFIDQADQALYQAKIAGRDRIAVFNKV